MLCLKCYRDIPAGEADCPVCGKAVVAGPAPAPAAEECAWERRGELGAFRALGETLQRSLFQPTAFFKTLEPEGKTGGAILYAVVIGTISAAVAMMWQQVAGMSAFEETELQLPHLEGVFWFMALAFLPLLVLVGTLFRSFMLHLVLLVMGGGKGFAATLKAVSYANSASAFGVFPFVGAPIGFFWRIALVVIGLREVHGISTGRAFLVWLIPFFVLVLLTALLVIAAVVAVMAIFPSVMNDLVQV